MAKKRKLEDILEQRQQARQNSSNIGNTRTISTGLPTTRQNIAIPRSTVNEVQQLAQTLYNRSSNLSTDQQNRLNSVVQNYSQTNTTQKDLSEQQKNRLSSIAQASQNVNKNDRFGLVKEQGKNFNLNKELSYEDAKEIAKLSGNDRMKKLNQVSKTEEQRKKNEQLVKQIVMNDMVEQRADKLNVTMQSGSTAEKVMATAGKLSLDFAKGAFFSVGDAYSTINSLLPDTKRDVWSGQIKEGANKEQVQAYKNVKDALSQENAMLESDLLKIGGNVSQTLGGMLMPGAIGSLAGISGTAKIAQLASRVTSGIQSGTGAYIDTLNENQDNKLQALATGGLKGLITYKIEGITGGNFMGKAKDAGTSKSIQVISKLKNETVKKLVSKFKDTVGEVGEENLENVLGHIVDLVLGNEELPTIDQFIQETLETTRDTALTTLVLGFLGLGGETYNEVKMYEQNQAPTIENKPISNQSQQVIQQEGKKAKNQTSKEIKTQTKKGDIRDEIISYLEKNGRQTSETNIEAFINRAQNFKLEENDNTNPELRNLIEKIQKDNIKKDLSYGNSFEEAQEQVKKFKNLTDISNKERVEIDELTELNMKERPDYKDIEEVKARYLIEANLQPGKRNDIEVETLIKKIKENGFIRPIYISRETGKVINGVHRILVAYELGLDNVPVKYVDSANDIEKIDMNENDWYNAVKDRRDGIGYTEDRTTGTSSRNTNERVYNQGRVGTSGYRGDNAENNKIYQGKQGNINRPSNEAIHDVSNTVGRRSIKDSNKSSFSMQKNNLETEKSLDDEYLQSQPDNSEMNEWERKVSKSMTPKQVEEMVERAFVANNIRSWYDDKYKNGLEWLRDVGADEVEMYIENTQEIQAKYINSNEDILNEEYLISDVLNAYLEGKLVGNVDNAVKRLDISKDTGYKSNKFYSPREIQGGIELYNKANERITNSNREEVYKARADFIINANRNGYIQQLGLTQADVNKKIKQWSGYDNRAMRISNEINNGASTQNRWAGIENSSILNTISVTEEQLNSMVKEIKGNSSEYERQYITSTMLAIDCHNDFSNLTFDFSPDRDSLGRNTLADYNPNTDLIRVGRSGQNTIAHEMGHYLDHLWGRQIFGNNLGITTRVSSTNLDNKNLTDNQKQFVKNFYNWFDSVESSADIGSKYKMTPTEVMARFVARFTEWTKNVATNNRYGYESKMYDDNFTESQYREFAKLLQEKSLLDTTEVFENYKKSSFGAGKIAQERLDDFFDDSFEKESDKRQLVDEVYREDIAEGKVRKHYKSVFDSDQVGDVGKDVAKELLKKDTYVPISNLETVTLVNDNISRNGIGATYNAFRTKVRSNEKITLQDVATGERLIQIYSQKGDYNKVNELIQDVAILGTELGQQVQAFNLIKRASPEGQLQYLTKLLDRTNIKENTDIKITKEMSEKILKSKDQSELEKNVSEVAVEIASQLPITGKDKIRSWRYLSMLGNPKTHFKNLGANVAMNLTQRTKNVVAGALEDVTSIFNPELERTKTLKFADKEQRKFAKDDADLMVNLIDAGGKYDVKNIIQNSKKQFDNRVLNAIAKFNSNLLDKEDKIFLKSAYKMAMQNYMSANNLKVSDMEGKTLEKARQYASLQAQEATFHEFNAVANTLSQLENKGGLVGGATSAILPFKKTPMNIAKAGIQYSPVGLAKSVTYDIGQIISKTKKYKQQLAEGKIKESEYKTETANMVNKTIDNMAKGLTGTSVAVLGFALAKLGILKAGNDEEDDEFKEKLGEQQYAITIGENSYTLDWVSPSAIPLFTGATIYQLMTGDADEQKSAINSTLTAFSKSFEPMTEMSMLQGLTSAITSYEQGSSNMLFDLGASMVTSYAGQFVPTLSGQVARIADPYERDTSTTKKGIEGKVDRFARQTMNKIPGLSQKLPKKTDVWGEDVKRPENLVQRTLETAVLPWTRKALTEDRTAQELLKVFDETGENILPGTPSKDLTINKEKYRLTTDEYNQAKQNFGQTSKNLLDDLFKSRTYNSLTSEGKAKAIEDVYSYAKEKLKVEYADSINQEIKTTTLYNTVESLKTNKANVSAYFEFKGKIDDLDREKGDEEVKKKEKIEYLESMKTNAKTKRIIYEDTLGTKDTMYKNLSKLTGNKVAIDQYLDYKTTELKADENEKSNIVGKTISGSKKKKVKQYIMDSDFSDIEKLYIYGSQYELNSREKSLFLQYVDNAKLDNDERNEILLKMKGVTEYKDGTITW